MPKRSTRQPLRREGRPQAPPPALMRGDEGIVGNSLLDELRTPAGTLLWQSLRDAALWAHAPAGRRGELFRPGRERARLAEIVRAGVDAELIGPLTTLARVLGSGPPPAQREVAAACRSMSQWADGRGLLKTALAFAQCAAVVAPADAAAAYRVGWLARRRAEYARAETWFRRAIALARRSEDRQSYSLAYVGLGNLYMQRGELHGAREALLKAYRSARRASLRQVQAMALHDLFIIAGYTGSLSDAHLYARDAFRAYGPRNARVPVLAHDVAWFWVRQGYHRRALPVLQAALGYPWRYSERILAVANLARAAGGAGDMTAFVGAWSEAWRLIDAQPETENVSEALLHLAYGAAYLGDAERTEVAVVYATKIARQRMEAKVLTELERVRESVRTTGQVRVEDPPEVRPEEMEVVEALTHDLLRALRAGTGNR